MTAGRNGVVRSGSPLQIMGVSGWPLGEREKRLAAGKQRIAVDRWQKLWVEAVLTRVATHIRVKIKPHLPR